ncbi:MAG: deacylase [Moritella sp.]|uniref:YbaK/EbsC family protein n=1 Tax=Moritella sp. TaxID=78556 RepID=UPI000C0F8586|nr:YbaK/EbsC family protein [Moritella sp.]MBL1417978.1 YbaK/EbsC family protein [Moritella sp.]PHR89366.1 MAG: deacylase [Moritella sp.]
MMAIAITLKEYFEHENIHYDTIKHRRTFTTLDSSRSAHLPAGNVAKAVVLESITGDYLMASLPANSRVSLTGVSQIMGKYYYLANEQRLQALFPDCVKGAIPAMGSAYDMSMIVDDSLLTADSVYIESGDHQNFLKLSNQEYSDLVEDMSHGDIRGKTMGAPRIWERTNINWRI